MCGSLDSRTKTDTSIFLSINISTYLQDGSVIYKMKHTFIGGWRQWEPLEHSMILDATFQCVQVWELIIHSFS